MELCDNMETLIFRNLEEVIGHDLLKSKLEAGKTLLCYIGFAPTGQVHVGYLVPCMKIRDLTLAGCNVAIMIADVHAILDERKTPSHLVELRSDYYRLIITKILEMLGANLNHVKFIKGSEFQLNGDYSMDVLELASRVTVSAARKAGTEVVKQSKELKLGSAIYPVMQAVDENYVGQMTFGHQADMELGGIDQRKIFCFSRDWDRKINDATISYLMNPILSLTKPKGLLNKMSSSDPNGKITFYDTDELIASKIKKAFCCDGDPDCGLMKLMKCVFFPLKVPFFDNNTITEVICVTLDCGKVLMYTEYEQFEDDFKKGVFVAQHVKQTIIELLYDVIDPIRQYINSEEIIHLISQAYPPEDIL